MNGMADETARRLLEVTRQLAVELHPERASRLRVRLESHLERELGFDSLGRAELMLRLEQAFKAPDWSAAVALRDASRAAILRLVEEPDLSDESVTFG